MRHTLEELFGEAYHYFPRGAASESRDTPEARNQQEAHDRACAEYGTWTAMLRRLTARFLEERFSGVEMENRAVFLQAPGTTPWSRCYKAWIWLPPDPGGRDRRVGLQVSFVVPYYMVYVWHDISGPGDATSEHAFEPAADEQPFVVAVKDEIEATYPKHQLMPPEVGMTVVPEIDAYGHGPGDKATIFDCLFSDTW
jgi:hypothetical protein